MREKLLAAGALTLLAVAALGANGTPKKIETHPARSLSVWQNPLPVMRGAEVTFEVKHDTSPPLRDMMILHTPPSERIHELRLLHPPRRPQHVNDSALQNSVLPNVNTTAGLSFDGIGVQNSAPPDTNGAVGATQFVEWVNEEFAVYNKTNGSLIFGPAGGNTLWSGFGGGCQTNNDGDPIAQYDKANNRWVMSQFSVSTTPFLQCVAVSTTSDATGTWNRYSFQQPYFNDYPKMGIWPDAYYESFNMFQGNNFVGGRACAFDGAAMRAGNTATQQCFQLSSSFGGLLPSDVDGKTAPPAGEPAFFVAFDNNEASLDLWSLHVDFVTPANTTFSGPVNLPVSAFSAACGGGTCIPQSGTSQQLDSLGDRIMYRLAYRNFGDHESLLVNHSITAGSSVGVRWYELRSPNSNPSVFQSGTFAPDSNYRWMASLAMDQAGDMALGYSVSSSSMHPAIRYTGRVPTDPLGTMESEATILQGNGSQNGGLTRWGDYTSMSVDPVDDCTFWYSNEYLPSNGSFNWATHIASFKFPGCGSTTPDFTISASPSSNTITQGGSTSYSVSIAPLNGYSNGVTLSATGLPSGASATFLPNPVTGGSGSSIMSVTTTGSVTTGTFTVTVKGTDGTLSHSTTVQLVINPAPVPDFTISASPSSNTVTQGGNASYTVSVSPLNGFTGSVSLSDSGLPPGASATFGTNPITRGSGSSTLNVSTSSSSPAGTYTITVTGTSGSLSHQTSVKLVVNQAGTFSLSANPSSLTITRGSSGTSTITVTANGGFNGTVSLSVSGAGSRVTTSLNPSSVNGSGTSTLKITVSSRASRGTRTLTVKGTSGSLSSSTTVTLTIR
ncbi:MAG: hypothetical protein ACRD50_16570 [Candidatus Acidiferrales bacterium]